MEKLKDLKDLIVTVFNSVQFKYRVYIPISISIIVILSVLLHTDINFWRKTVGYDLLGLSYFVSIFSIINFVQVRKINYPKKNLILGLNLFFIIFFLFVRNIFTMKTGLLRIGGTFEYYKGLFPLIKISLIYLILIFILNRKEIVQKLKSMTIIILSVFFTSCSEEYISVNIEDPKLDPLETSGYNPIFKKQYYDGDLFTGEVISYLKVPNGDLDPILVESDKLAFKKVFRNGILVNDSIYIQGKLREVNNYNPENGSKEGDYIRFHENGIIDDKYTYIGGDFVGERISYFQNGKLRYKENYKEGKINGETLLYYENGKLEFKHNYLNGELDGEQIYYTEDGKVSKKENYVNGSREGTWEEFFTNNLETNGLLFRRQTFVNNNLNGEYLKFDTNHDPVNNIDTVFLFEKRYYKDGKQHGTNFMYYIDGTTHETLYDDGRRISEKKY